MIHHLSRLSDTIFALAMALTIFGFDFPKFATSINNSEINEFLLSQLEPLGNYLITFAILAFYWIDHVKQFSYYQRTNEVHLWLYLIYLMCLFIVPYSNVLIMNFPQSSVVQICYSINIFLIGLFSFLNWTYATYKHKLVDINLDDTAIQYIRITSLIEPTVALITIIVALLIPSLWDISWVSVIFLYIIVEMFIKKSVSTNRRDAEDTEAIN
ncbi:TMEM175 family protein [Rivularia sp. UHCC 0363]|uniref:TMEM175 family protein n=1 Tax=Rivularia sp. UHCC 0363 TaxID=3110244 RepID=UPI002B221681|nr:TMEM175 family protein [Rivularia sp. UHCC 0363]MEA5597501.1 TMEM175 family protein [Rivularia sp. UHCC 0363]